MAIDDNNTMLWQRWFVRVMKIDGYKIITKEGKLTSGRAANLGYQKRHQIRHPRDDKRMHANRYRSREGRVGY